MSLVKDENGLLIYRRQPQISPLPGLYTAIQKETGNKICEITYGIGGIKDAFINTEQSLAANFELIKKAVELTDQIELEKQNKV